MLCDSVLVIVIGSDKTESENVFDLQTFKIDNKTSFKILKETIHNFWQLSEKENEYNLFMLEFKSHYEIKNTDENEKDLIIDDFLKSKTSIHKAQFMYIHNSKLGKIKFIIIFAIIN